MTDKTAIEKARDDAGEEVRRFINLHEWSSSERISATYTAYHIINFMSEPLAAIDVEKPAEKYCIRCGYAIPEYFHICTKCGQPADEEKPVEDAEEVAISIANLFSTYTLRNNKHVPASVEAAQLLTNYAEIYHARKTAEESSIKHSEEQRHCRTCKHDKKQMIYPGPCTGVFPTHVGVFPIVMLTGAARVSFPHARGGVSTMSR